MICERHMKQAKWIAKDEMVRGYLFYMHYDTVATPYMAIEPLTANDYGEISSFCYCEIDPATVEDVAAMPLTGDVCPNCLKVFYRNYNYCPCCGQRIEWNIESERRT